MVANSYRVEVNYHPPTARAPLACHPRTTLHVVHASLDASHAGTLLVGTHLVAATNLCHKLVYVVVVSVVYAVDIG